MAPPANDISAENDRNKEHRLIGLNLSNKILQTRLDYLTILRQHYESYWLDLDLKCYEARLTCLVNKAKFLTYQAIAEKIQKLKDEIESLDVDISQNSHRLQQFKSLNPDLLAEYRTLKDDLDCQDMLIKISEGNLSQDS